MATLKASYVVEVDTWQELEEEVPVATAPADTVVIVVAEDKVVDMDNRKP